MTNFKEKYQRRVELIMDEKVQGELFNVEENLVFSAEQIHNKILDEIVEEAEANSGRIDVVNEDGSIVRTICLELLTLRQIIQSKKGENK